jgi:hypothetical protein
LSVYQLRTFDDILEAVREELQIGSSDTTALNRIRRDINIVYEEVVSENQWHWLTGHCQVQLPAVVTTGTASVTSGSATVTLTTAPGPSKLGHYFSVEGYSEIYTIESHTAGSTTVKLAVEYTGSTNATASYKIWTDKVALPTDCKETIKVRHDHYGVPLQKVGLQEYRDIVGMAPKAAGKPTTYCLGDYRDPSSTSSISSLPAISTRASAGLVKTIVFASGIPTATVTKITNGEPVKWRISAAGDATYNGDIYISSVSTTSVASDTITYVGRAELQESATSDSTLSISAIDAEETYDRYRELLVYPAINTSKTTLQVDYVRTVLPLENDTDEPLIPQADRVVLLYGALSRAWDRMRNEEMANKAYAKYTQKLAKMQGKLLDNFDKPKLAPSSRYLGAKRSIMRGMSARRALGPADGSGGGLGGSVVTGTANTVATFDSNGELEGSSTISTTELGYLNGVSSNIQTQLDTITTLADGKIYVGNASNNAVEVTPSGDVTISNAGVTAIGAGVIVDADINAAAAITRSKLAAGTASHVVIHDGSGNLSSEATLAASRGGMATNASAFTGVVKASAGTFSAATVVNADVSATAAIALTKLADIAAGSVLMGNGSNVPTATALSGDVTVDSSGVTAIGAGVIVNADINGSAGIARSKIANGTAYGVVTNDLNGAMTSVAPGAANNVLKSDGTQWTSGSVSIPSLSVASKSANYTLTSSDDVILADASGGAFTLTLPAAASNTGKVFYIIRTDNTPANALTLDGNGAETIQGATTRALYTQYESVKIISDGSNWAVLEHKTNTTTVSWTPSWTASTANPTVGNATIESYWSRRGDKIYGSIRLLFGSTSAAGTGVWRFSLPTGITVDTAKIGLSSSATINVVGTGALLDSGAFSAPVNATYNSSASVLQASYWDDGAGHVDYANDVGAAAPMAWATNDEIKFDFELPVTGWWA